jgi:hypothetical protein
MMTSPFIAVQEGRGILLFYVTFGVSGSEADQECFSRIPHPDFINPGYNKSKKEKREKISCPFFFCSHKYHKIENYFFFEQVKKGI